MDCFDRVLPGHTGLPFGPVGPHRVWLAGSSRQISRHEVLVSTGPDSPIRTRTRVWYRRSRATHSGCVGRTTRCICEGSPSRRILFRAPDERIRSLKVSSSGFLATPVSTKVQLSGGRGSWRAPWCRCGRAMHAPWSPQPRPAIELGGRSQDAEERQRCLLRRRGRREGDWTRRSRTASLARRRGHLAPRREAGGRRRLRRTGRAGRPLSPRRDRRLARRRASGPRRLASERALACYYRLRDPYWVRPRIWSRFTVCPSKLHSAPRNALTWRYVADIRVIEYRGALRMATRTLLGLVARYRRRWTSERSNSAFRHGRERRPDHLRQRRPESAGLAGDGQGQPPVMTLGRYSAPSQVTKALRADLLNDTIPSE